METTDVIEHKKQKLNPEITTHVLPVPPLAKPDESRLTLLAGQNPERREDSNAEVIHPDLACRPAEKIGDADPDAVGTVEQNSSGFGDEIGIEDEKISETDVELAKPNIFQTDDLTFSDRLEAYSIIFEICDISNIHRKMFDYLNENVIFEGWKAIWKIEKFGLEDCDVLVEVDAAPTALATHIKAQVRLVEPFHCIASGAMCIGKELEEKKMKITELLTHETGSVDLIDLYPLFDETGRLDDTALAIEHARFFYQNLWRPMDDEDDVEGSTFMDKYLKQRLKFFYDIQEKNLPAHIVRIHKKMLSEYLAKCERLQAFQDQLTDSDGSDINLDMNESRIAADIMDLHEQIEVLKIKLDKLENPFLRSLTGIPTGLLSETDTGKRLARNDNSTRTHLVADKLTVGMILSLGLPPDAIIEHHQYPGVALTHCYNGDTILIFPGSYPGKGFYTLKNSVTIKGVGRREEILIVCEELADIFLDCDAQSATISNLTLADENGETWDGLVAVRPGSKLVIEDCVLQNGAMGVTVFGGGVLEMNRCEIRDIQKSGARCKAGSSVHISHTHVHHCGLLHRDTKECDSGVVPPAGISVEVQESDEDNQTTLSITNSKVCDNHGAALAVVISSKQEEELEPITADVIGLISGVKVTDISKNDFSNNEHGDAFLVRVIDK